MEKKLKAEFVNPFVMSAFDILKRVVGVTGSKGVLSTKKKPFISQEVTIVIGVVGKLRGQVTVGMSEKTAMAFSSRMLFGLEIVKLDQMALSAVGEFANMLIGNAGILLSKEGYTCDISPPTIIVGNKGDEELVDLTTIVLPIQTELGVIEVDIAIEETDK